MFIQQVTKSFGPIPTGRREKLPSRPRYKPASGPAFAPPAEVQLGGGDFAQLGAQERSFDTHDGLAYPVYDGPGSPESRDLQAQVLQHAAGFKPDVSLFNGGSSSASSSRVDLLGRVPN